MSPRTQIITLEGVLPASEAAWNTTALKYLPFDVPAGVTAIHVHREFHPHQKHTVATLLFDAEGLDHGFRGYQGQVNTDPEFDITPEPDTTTPWYLPGTLQPGRWHIGHWYLKAISHHLRYRYTITMTMSRNVQSSTVFPPYEPGVIVPHPGWYVGGLHNHTFYSYDAHIGGKPHTLQELVGKYAESGFNFLAVTDHNQPRSHYELSSAAQAYPELLLIPGNELTTLHGHANALFIPPGFSGDFRLDPGDGRLPAFIRQVHDAGGLFSVNHPFQKCADCWWRYPEHEWREADAIEVWNRPWMDINRQAVDFWDGLLKRGRRITAVGGADYHRGPQPLVPATRVHARELSLSGIREGIRRGRVTLSEHSTGPIIYMNTADGRAMVGDVVNAPDESQIPIVVRVVGGSGCTLRLVSRYGERSVRIGSRDQVVEHTLETGPGRGNYVRAELLRRSGDVCALTNPIYA